MNKLSIKLLLSTTFLVSTVLPSQKLFAMDEASSSAPIGDDSLGRPSTVSLKLEEVTSSKKSLSLTEIRKGILNKDVSLEDRIKKYNLPSIVEEVSAEIAGLSSLPRERVFELAQKAMWSVSFFYHMTGTLIVGETRELLDNLLKKTESQKISSTSQPSSSSQKRTGGKKKPPKASQSQTSSSSTQNNPFDRLTEMLNGDQRRVLKILFDGVSGQGKKIKREQFFPDLNMAFFKLSERKEIEREFNQFENEILSISDLARKIKEITKLEVFSQDITDNVIGSVNDSGFYRLALLFDGPAQVLNLDNYLEINQKNGNTKEGLAAFFTEIDLPEIKRYLALMYFKGDIGRLADGQPNKAKWIQLFEEANTPESNYELGLIHVNGELNGTRNYDEARKYFTRANTPKANFEIGVMFKDGQIGLLSDGTPNYEEAKKYFLKSNTAHAIHNLAVLQIRGYVDQLPNGTPNYEKAAENYRKSNTPKTNYELGCMYQEGKIGRLSDGTPNYEEAKKYLEKSDTPEAKAVLDFIILQEKLKKYKDNYKKIQPFLEKVNTPSAKALLGELYEKGKIGRLPNGEPDCEKAARYCRESGTPEAKYSLGVMYMEGQIGDKPNDEEAKRFFEESDIPDAKYNLGVMYARGRIGRLADGSPNYAIAAKYFENSNIDKAKCDHGILYMAGQIGRLLDGNIDYETAARLFKDSGTSIAKNNLGCMYMAGYVGRLPNGEPDYEEAKRFLEESDTPEAKYNLGWMYIKGYIGRLPNGELDYEEGIRHLSAAVLGGMTEEKSLLNKVMLLVDFLKKQNNAQIPAESSFSEKDVPDIEIDSGIGSESIAAPSNAGDSFFDTTPSESRAIPHQKQKKEKISREQRIQQLKAEIAQAKIQSIDVLSQRNQTQTFKIEFDSEELKQEYDRMMDPNNEKQEAVKLREVMEDIKVKPWGTEGSGKPERLKGRDGLWSRRLNHKDRLVYNIEVGKIVILSLKGHYDD